MLHDSQTDFVFLPMAIRYHFPRLYKSLIEAFVAARVRFWEIPYTENKTCLWVRDWMPITIDRKGDIAQFCYDPDYLRASRYDDYKPFMYPILEDLEITPFRYEDIILDGGNVLTDKQGRAYMTDKIFLENPNYSREQLLAKLKHALNARSIKIVHWDKSDIYGHVDGMMAIADDGSLITDLSWEYLNFLRVGNKIFMAQLGKPTDEPAVKRIREAFPDCEVYPIKYAQSLTRLGGGLHCATWNTVEHGYRNARYFKPSKRHPFNPFDVEAFTEERLRGVVEYYSKHLLSDDEWSAFYNAFKKYWDVRYDYDTDFTDFSDFSAKTMYEVIRTNLKEQNSPYFSTENELKQVIGILVSYLINIPFFNLPKKTTYNPKNMYIPAAVMLVHFRDCYADLVSFSIDFEYRTKDVKDQLKFTKQVEREAKEAEERKDGTIYILHYRTCDKRRICPYRYTLIAHRCFDEYIRIIIYDDVPLAYLRLANYFEHVTSRIRFYDNYRKGDCYFDYRLNPHIDEQDLPF